MKHASLSESLIRPPGTPAAACPGRLRRVNGAGTLLERDAPPDLDAALAHEGEFGDVMMIYLWHCWGCGQTVVEARTQGDPDRRFQRNAWSKSRTLEV